jgi:hypothetical protein
VDAINNSVASFILWQPVAANNSAWCPRNRRSIPRVDAVIDQNASAWVGNSWKSPAAVPGISESTHSGRFSTLLGAAAVATSGYHLAFRDNDPFRERWLTRRVGAGRRRRGVSGR